MIINREIFKFQVVPSCFRLLELFFHGCIMYMSKSLKWEGKLPQNLHRYVVQIKYQQMSHTVRYSSVYVQTCNYINSNKGVRWVRHLFW
jgi:hypothetical protein